MWRAVQLQANNSLNLLRNVRLFKGNSKLMQYEVRWGLVLLSPWIIGFLLLTLFPLGTTFYYSFLHFHLLAPDKAYFVGLSNYARFFHDPNVAHALRITLTFAVLALPIRLAVPVGLAALLTSRALFGKRILQALFYLPSLIPDIAMVFIWGGFISDSGWLNRVVLGPLHLPPLEWPPENAIALYIALILMGLWGIGPATLIAIAAMRNVPTDLYEAAEVDGAGLAQRFFRITLPMISPVTFFLLLLTLVTALQSVATGLISTISWGRTGVGGYDSYLYMVMFRGRDVGYAATLSWMLLLGMMVITVILFFSARYWVHYEEGER